MSAPAPFIYVASLRRTGSRLIAHELSQWPAADVLLEPGVARGRFSPKPEEVDRYAALGIDLEAHRGAVQAAAPEDCVRLFRDELLPRMQEHVGQVGIKEIHHERWEDVMNAFPEARVVVTARDPRDIYLSLFHKSTRRRRPLRLHGPFSPSVVAEDLDRDFAFLRGIMDRARCHLVRYEDYCSHPEERLRLRRFVGSRIEGDGDLARLGTHDQARHGTSVTSRSVARWRDEPDPRLRAEAEETFQRMEAYRAFWGYGADGPDPSIPAREAAR